MRTCSITGNRFKAGFYFESLGIYVENEEHALFVAKANGFKNLDESYEMEFHYYSEWDEEEEEN
jgi:hypothetical protein